MSSCVSCNTAPSPCQCSATETCVQTSRTCTTCPQNICIRSSSSSNPTSSNNGLGGLIGGTLGGVLGSLALITLGWFAYRRGLFNRLLPILYHHHPKHHSKNHSTLLNHSSKSNTHPSTSSTDPHHRYSKGLNTHHTRSRLPNTSTHLEPIIESQIKKPINEITLNANHSNITTQNESGHQKTASTSSRQLTESIINKRNSAHMMDILSPEVIDEPRRRTGDLLGLNLTRQSALIIEDDPFSDRNSTVLFSRQLPPIRNANSPLLGIDSALFGLNPSSPSNPIPVAYIPSNSKSLSIQDVEDRDGLGNTSPRIISPSSVGSGPDPILRRLSHNLISIDSPDLHHQHSRSPHHSPSAASALQSAFITPHHPALSVLPPSTGANGGTVKPIRPPRAPGLDLRLPTTNTNATNTAPVARTITSPNHTHTHPDPPNPSRFLERQASADSFGHNFNKSNIIGSRFSVNSSVARYSTVSHTASSSGRWSQPPPMPDSASSSRPRHHYGSTDGMPLGSRLSLDSSHHHHSLLHHHQIRPMSNVSEATTHDSHLSSILDPAMIVTPVTLVRTASGRQAAVQRVALRGQEKARVVRLKRSSSSATQPPLPALPHPRVSQQHSVTHLTPDLITSPEETLTGLPESPNLVQRTMNSRSSIVDRRSHQDLMANNDDQAAIVARGSAHQLAAHDDPFTDSAAISTNPSDPNTTTTTTPSSSSSSSSINTTLGPSWAEARDHSPLTTRSQETPSLYSTSTTATVADDGHDSRELLVLTPLSPHPQDRTQSTVAVVGAFSRSFSSQDTPSCYSDPTTAIADDGHVTSDGSASSNSRVQSSASLTVIGNVPDVRLVNPTHHSRLTASSLGEQSQVSGLDRESVMSDDLGSMIVGGHRITNPTSVAEVERRSAYGMSLPDPGGSRTISLSSMIEDELGRGFGTNSSVDVHSRVSVVSTSISIRSGYGSVLEGIPFNIGFSNDEFGGLGDLTGVEEDEE